jgi:hypothetical protein
VPKEQKFIKNLLNCFTNCAKYPQKGGLGATLLGFSPIFPTLLGAGLICSVLLAFARFWLEFVQKGALPRLRRAFGPGSASK